MADGVNIRSNLDAITRDMERKYKKQIPYATSKAINDVAKKAEATVKGEIKKLNNPTPYTIKATFVKYSNKNQSPIQAIVGIKDRQAEYLQYPEEGGTSRAKKKAKPVPTSSSKNRYGNLAKGTTKRIGNGKVFSGTPQGGRPGGIYQRMGTKKNPKLKMLATWKTETQHHKRIRIGERVRLVVKRNIDKALMKRVAEAIKSAM